MIVINKSMRDGKDDPVVCELLRRLYGLCKEHSNRQVGGGRQPLGGLVNSKLYSFEYEDLPPREQMLVVKIVRELPVWKPIPGGSDKHFSLYFNCYSEPGIEYVVHHRT